MKHILKISDENFLKIIFGLKTFEIRKNDENYQVDDLIHFVDEEGKDFYNYVNKDFRITYVLSHKENKEVPEGNVIFSIKEVINF